MTKEQSHSSTEEDLNEKKDTINLNVNQLYDGTTTPSASDNSDPEAQEGTLSHHILKNGQQVLVTWAPEEESAIVRKLDFLFLPIFSVRLPNIPFSVIHFATNLPS